MEIMGRLPTVSGSTRLTLVNPAPSSQSRSWAATNMPMENTKRRVRPIPNDHALGRRSTGCGVEAGTIDGEVAVALGDEAGRHRRSSSTRLLFSMRSLPAGQKHTVGLVQHAPVVGVVEVPEGGKTSSP